MEKFQSQRDAFIKQTKIIFRDPLIKLSTLLVSKFQDFLHVSQQNST